MFEEYRPDAKKRGRLGVAVRTAGPADLAAMAAIRAERHGEPLETSRAAIERGLNRCALLLVAEHEGRVIAYASADFLETGDGPRGWYLTGVIVAPEWRRRGVATALIRARLAWLAPRTKRVYYFCNSRNLVSMDAHKPFGFEEIQRPFRAEGHTFDGEAGVLFRAEL